jgi:hypothetical protein
LITDILGDFTNADNPAVPILYRGNAQGNLDVFTSFSYPVCFEMINAFPLCQPVQDVWFLVAKCLLESGSKQTARSFPGPIAKYAFGR